MITYRRSLMIRCLLLVIGSSLSAPFGTPQSTAPKTSSTQPKVPPSSKTGPVAATTTGAAVPAQSGGLTVDDVIKMVQVKLADDLVISQIKKNGKPFSLSTNELVRLKTAGASDSVIRIMIDPEAIVEPPPPLPSVPAGTNNSRAPEVVSTTAGSLATQDTTVQEPEYSGAVFYIDPTTGTLTPLEKQSSNVVGKLKAFGWGGATGSIVFNGAKSPVRFTVGQEIHFVVRGIPQGIDPENVANLDVLTVSKDQRGIVAMKVGLLSGAKTQAGKTLRPLMFSKYGEHSHTFWPAHQLEPGEYVITGRGSRTAFLFGIDPK